MSQQESEDFFRTANVFARHIESMVKTGDMGYIDTIIYLCEKNEIEIETVGALIGKTLKAKIRREARDKNLLMKISKLPFLS